MKKLFSFFLSISLALSMTSFASATGEPESFSLNRYDFSTQEESIVTVPSVSTYDASARISSAYNPTNSRMIIEDADPDDDRQIVSNPTLSPYYAIVQLKMEFSNGETFVGTGFMISEDTLLTAAHCLYSENEKTLRTNRVTVYAGRNGSSYTTTTTAATMYTDTQYTEYGDDYEYDYAILTLNSSIGQTTGWLGLYASPLTGFYTGRSILTAGYPTDKTGTLANTMWRSAGTIQSVESLKFAHTADTMGGQSGSPIYYNNTSNGYVALGIHVGAYENGTINYGKRITVTLFDWLESEGYINS